LEPWHDSWAISVEESKFGEDARGLLQLQAGRCDWVRDDAGEPRSFTKVEAEAEIARLGRRESRPAGVEEVRVTLREHPFLSYDPAPSFEDVSWNYDPAASGARRRAFVLSDRKPRQCFVLVAYEDGRWALDGSRAQYVAEGNEASLEAAQRRVFNVWKAMTA
jgi:hypothetical protein